MMDKAGTDSQAHVDYLRILCHNANCYDLKACSSLCIMRASLRLDNSASEYAFSG